MSDDVRDPVLAHGPLDDPAQLELGLLGVDLPDDESPLDVDQDSIVFLDFGDGEDVYGRGEREGSGAYP